MKIHDKNQSTLPAEESDFAGIHGIDYFFREIDQQYDYRMSQDHWDLTYDPDYWMEVCGEYHYFPRKILDEFTTGMFSIPFSDFKPLDLKSSDRRGYRYCYTYKNKVNLYVVSIYEKNQHTRNSLHVEVKGGYLEYIKWDGLKQEQFASFADSKGASVGNWHSFIDHRKLRLSFDRMKEHCDRHWFRSDYYVTQWTGKSGESARGFQFGADGGKSILKVYESGRHRRKGEEQYLDYLRLEVKLRDEHAMKAYQEWRAGRSLYEVTRDRIAKQVEFLPANSPKNKARSRVKKLAPWWSEFIDGAVPVEMKTPKRNPTEEGKLASRLRTIKKWLNENDPQQIVGEVLTVLQQETQEPADILTTAVTEYFQAISPKVSLL